MGDEGRYFQELADLVARLRDPETGCPWDLKQTHASIKECALEEAYEVVDAIDAGPEKLKEELGDLLLQVVLHSQIARDQGEFTVNDVMRIITAKLIKRHPHIFGNVEVKDAEEVTSNWEKIKRSERDREKSMLESIPRSLPALMKAERFGERTARIGFDWPDSDELKGRVLQDLTALLEKISGPPVDQAALDEQFGKFFFELAQLARKVNCNAEAALNKACAAFAARFKRMEELAGSGLGEMSSTEMLELWAQADKSQE